MFEIIEKAPAKINLGLNVIGKRADGYHDLEMVMTSIDLSDIVSVRETADGAISLAINNGNSLPLDDRNHVYLAAKILREKFGITSGVEIELDKKIPIQAGLAGGSSDAAATLRALNELWKLDLSLEELAKIGEEIGSDVPYCVYSKTAFVTGRGENVELMAPMMPSWVVLIKPDFGVSTKDIFEALKPEQYNDVACAKIREAVEVADYDALTAAMGNTLEDVTIKLYPVIEKIKETAIDNGATAAMMSGSGPSVFAICKTENQAKRVYSSVKGYCKDVYMVRSL
ncbi:MAG: 4-(cytidine 5'-diphospho)-2-C-methyl-D-erythritol kinase [Lactobacillales bacterium]|jgi:4-diphosphocytidyl-2C-methyl-D-erythritol kinase|nr:4-(cytidine 5'-diphospho)-2-C-methyl-D-erythritol kinase [Lactobacillales bacterium]